MASDWHWCAIGVAGFIAFVILMYFSIGIIRASILRRMLSRWSRFTKKSKTLIVHCPPKALTIPNASPFVMKLLTFLKMAKIPYEIDTKDPFGGKGKTPWISYQGENVADSENIISFLTRKFNVNLNGSYTDEQLALATTVRIMLEEHLLWGLALERFVYGGPKKVLKVIKIPSIFLKIIKIVLKGRAEAQGTGLHSEEEVVGMMSKDLRILSKILDKKIFICGDSPCTEDAAIFGLLSEFYWALPNSPYDHILNGEASNLLAYCLRMRHKFWPDWND